MNSTLDKKKGAFLIMFFGVLLGTGLLMAGIISTKKQGIEIKSVRLSAMGYMLDVRYKVSDPEKASKVLKKNLRPYIIEEKTGAKLFVPTPGKVGPLRQIAQGPSKGRSYFMLFANPGRRLRPGDRVTLVLGDYKARHLAVQ